MIREWHASLLGQSTGESEFLPKSAEKYGNGFRSWLPVAITWRSCEISA